MERDLFSQAKTIATLDRLSGGLVMIGTGVGWNREEFENVSPYPFNKPDQVMPMIDRFAEIIPALSE